VDFVFTHCSIVLEHEILRDGALDIRNGVIAWIGETKNLPGHGSKEIDLGGFLLAPGYVDLHVHGGGGVDSCALDNASLDIILKTHAAYGTTSLCLALYSSDPERTKKILSSIASMASSGSGSSRLLGSYLIGPFISPSRCGVHDVDFLCEPDLGLLADFANAAAGWLRIVTIAPELPGSDSLIDWLSRAGIVASIGHTSSTFEQAEIALRRGCRLVTHLFNGMKPFHHRDPNAAGAALISDDAFAEIVLCESHVHYGAVKLALKALGADRVALVSSSTSLFGANGVDCHIGDAQITLVDGAARTASGLLAGSASCIADAVRNAVDLCQLDIPTAVRCASLVPAKVLGISGQLGSIAVGKHADLIVLDPSDLRVLESYVAGVRVFRSPY